MYIAISNSIGSSSRVNGGGGGGGFTNTYSLAFDGVDDYINGGNSSDLQITSDISISVWFKTTSTNTMIMVAKRDSPLGGNTYGYQVYCSGGKVAFLVTRSGPTTTSVVGTTTISDGEWHHVLCTINQASRIAIILDGATEGTSSLPAGTFIDSGSDLLIGYNEIGASSYYFDGNLDEVAIFNSLQSGSVIYNGGEPADLTSLNPVSWWRNGDNGTWKSPQWLIPNNSNKDKVSNYSFSFDGVDDYINTGTNSLIGASTLTISAWFKSSDVDSQYLLGDTSVRFSIRQSNGDTRISFTGSTDPFRGFGIPYNVGEWNNIILTFDGSLVQADRLKLYHNGVEINNINAGTPSTTLLLNTAASFMIGRVGGTLINTWNGSIDEVAYWNSVQNASTIYNSGTPADLTSLSPLSWWRMGEDSTFNTNWTVPDQVGSNDGTSANMTIEDRVGDAPNSTSNAVSFNMTESDRETDVPS